MTDDPTTKPCPDCTEVERNYLAGQCRVLDNGCRGTGRVPLTTDELLVGVCTAVEAKTEYGPHPQIRVIAEADYGYVAIESWVGMKLLDEWEGEDIADALRAALRAIAE